MNSQKINAYKNQQIMSAPPEKLTLMLYYGALRFLGECIAATEQGNIEKAHRANIRVQDIVRELVNTLDMSYEISRDWARLYEYTEYCLIQGNIKKDTQPLLQAKDVLQELRDAWEAAMEQTHQERVSGK